MLRHHFVVIFPHLYVYPMFQKCSFLRQGVPLLVT
jgi:hypothetical protein